MFQDKKIYTTQWAGKELTVELGEMARQANAAVVVKYGDTVVLTTAVASKEAKDVDFFPLTVNYEEKYLEDSCVVKDVQEQRLH